MELRVPPVALVLASALLMWVIRQLLPVPRLAIPGAGVVALGLAAGGVAAALLGVISFRKARTTVDPLSPQRASALVLSGVYRYSRNPMYLGFALVLLAWGIWLSSGPALLVVPAFVFYLDRYQIRPEEHILENRFGREYLDYRQRVRRWL